MVKIYNQPQHLFNGDFYPYIDPSPSKT